MKKHTVFLAALVLMTLVLSSSSSGQVRTVTLDLNYTGAPVFATRTTDAHGSIVGEPLPVPARAGQTFRGWFTAASGGSQVIVGASGTAFTEDAAIYARWVAASPVDMNSMPPAMKENFDWLKNDRYPRERYMPISLPGGNGWYNTIFDQIWDGNGSVNIGVRWETNANITLAQRRQIAAMLHDGINAWTRPLIGMEGWPFQEISVKVSGWAVSNGGRIVDARPNETVWVNNTYDDPGPASSSHPTDRIASAPRAMTRVNNLGTIRNNRNYQYGGDPHARVDHYLWATEYDFGAAGHGSWWGQRLRSADIISAANTHGGNGRVSGVLLHEVGHGFGLYDFYGAVGTDKPPATSGGCVFGNSNSSISGCPDLRGQMWNATTATAALNEYDQWQIRYWWEWLRTATPANANRFPAPATGTAEPVAARTARATRSQFKLDSRGIFRYDLGGAQTASLKIFDSRGRSVRTVRLSGTQTSVNTNLNVAPQMLIWRVESAGRVVDQGLARFAPRTRPREKPL